MTTNTVDHGPILRKWHIDEGGDIISDWKRQGDWIAGQTGLGLYLLGAKQPTLQDPRWGGDTWAGKAVPHIVNFDYPVYGSHIDCAVGGQFRALDESEKAWVEVWKLATNYGWWATTILYVICVCDQKGYITGFTNFVFYALVFLPCTVFTVAGLMVKPRVSIPILIVNLQLLWYIIKWILAIVFIPVGIAWILIKLQQWFGK